MKLKRYEVGGRLGYDSRMISHLDGEWVKYSDMQAYIVELIESISLDWNHQLISGGALNEENPIDESKV